ncbi:SurA N-terminal domain-containing protein [Bacillus weihaiensis]|uniref:SurA N-terminal domain-containing protein n=1 Tax=Bacillus weihaiensis TaxID=1547283 RepID=UPI002352945F|nr:SurA N-terminal domain-containing protein [Bacillus weihaiensis]
MNKLMATLLMALFALTLAACNNDEEKEKETSEETAQSDTASEEEAVDPEELQKKLEEQKVEEDLVVAVVNGKEIKGGEYNNTLALFQSNALGQGQDVTTDEMTKQIKESTLDFIVGQALIMQEVEKKGYEATEEEINEQLETQKAGFENDEAFEAALKESNLTIDDLKAQIEDNVKITQYLDHDINVEDVTDEEVKKFYDSLVEANGESEETPEYEDVKDTLKNNLQQQKEQKQISTRIAELKKESEIELKI